MKKITLAFLVLFSFLLVGIYTLSFLYPASNSPVVSSNGELLVASAPLSVSEVSKHSLQSDCYLIISDKVYDVSTYINKHPGGKKSIITRCGKDMTGIFASIHSNFAWDLLGSYYIGQLSTGATNIADLPSASSLADIQQLISDKYPGAEILSVKPRKDFYIGKLIFENSLYEVHIKASGEIVSEELEDDEYDWELWDEDEDD